MSVEGQDDLSCCCCVPMGMSSHVIAGVDIIFWVFIIIQGFEYLYAMNDRRAMSIPSIRKFYMVMTGMYFSAATLYSLPKIVMYFITFRGQRNTLYDRLKKYFRTRVFCLVVLFLILFAVNICVMVLAVDLANPHAYDVSKNWITFFGLLMSFAWIGVDLYWSIVIRTYKDSKKGKSARNAAKRLSKMIDPNENLFHNVKEVEYKTSIET